MGPSGTGLGAGGTAHNVVRGADRVMPLVMGWFNAPGPHRGCLRLRCGLGSTREKVWRKLPARAARDVGMGTGNKSQAAGPRAAHHARSERMRARLRGCPSPCILAWHGAQGEPRDALSGVMKHHALIAARAGFPGLTGRGMPGAGWTATGTAVGYKRAGRPGRRI
jgi:hypothetical protein